MVAGSESIDHLFTVADPVLRPAVGAVGGAWSTLDPLTLLDTRCQLIFDLGDGPQPLPQDVARERRLFELEWLDEAPNTFTDLWRSGRTAAALSIDIGDPSTVPRFAELLAPLGATDELRVLLRAAGAAWGVLCLYRAVGTFSASDVAVAEACAPVLAVELRALLLRLASAGPTATAPGSLLLDADDATIVTSPQAESLLGEADEAVVGPTLRSLAAATRRRGAASALMPARRAMVSLHGAPAKGLDGGVMVVVQHVGADRVVPLLMARLGLTDSESRVVELVLRGESRVSAARSLGISVHTVGDHLSAVYGKAGVSSRAELCALVFDLVYLPRRDEGATPDAFGHYLPVD